MSERQIDGETRRFAHYRLGHLLGEGGFGRVHSAWDERLAREVAIKFASADRRRQEGLRYEAQRLASQRHRAFVGVFALEERPEELAMVMELVRGRTLAQALRDTGPLPQEHVLRLGVEATAALAEAHRSGWAHGDLKPSNLMLADDGSLRILDFGAAASIDPADTLSSISGDARAGTLAYLAPERLLGARASTRSDVYSLGLVLYEALTRRRGMEDEDGWSDLHQRLHGRDSGRWLPLRFDAGLRALVERMTRRRAQGRPASMAQVHKELLRLQAKQWHGSLRGRRRGGAVGILMESLPAPRHEGGATPGESPGSRVRGEDGMASFELADAAIIRVSFDVEQLGTDLLWRASDTESPGPCPGLFRLEEGLSN